MTPVELKSIRECLKLSQVDFGRELGYCGSDNTVSLTISRYERGLKVPIPTYIARLAYMLLEHFESEDGCFPLWPTSCAHNPAKPNGDRK